MPMVSADWTITRSNGNVRYIGDDHGGASPSYATVIEFHRWLQDFADDASSAGDDEHDITDPTSSDRSTDNIVTLLNSFNIDATAAEHLYDGSIIQNGGDDIYDGIVNFGNASVQIQVHQNGAVLADDWWNFGGGGLNADVANGISHRFMIQVRSAGADIDGRRLLGTTRAFGNTYGEFPINGTSRGNNVLALSDSTDLNNQSLIGDVALWTSITNLTEGYALLDVNNDTTDEAYYSEWDEGAGGETGRAGTINDIYERLKWLTRDGSSSTLYGLNGELFRGITHELDVDTPTGTFNAFEAVSWTGGTGQMLAIDSTTAATKMWIQLLTGAVPSDNDVITGGTSAATVQLNVTVTERTVSAPFVGQSTGSNLIGAYGLGVETGDLAAQDTLFDLTNTAITPPNNVTFTVLGLVSGEDRILVGPESTGTLDTGQLSANGAQSSGAGTFLVNEVIPSDTPSPGTVRIFNGTSFDRVPYTSFAASTFTLTGTLPNNVSANADAFISYIDELASATSASFTAVYSSDRSLFVRDRDGGGTPIKTFETTATLGSAGGSVTVIRTSDT